MFQSKRNRKAGVFKFLRFGDLFWKAPSISSWRISVDGRPNLRNQPTLSNFSGVHGVDASVPYNRNSNLQANLAPHSIKLNQLRFTHLRGTEQYCKNRKKYIYIYHAQAFVLPQIFMGTRLSNWWKADKDNHRQDGLGSCSPTECTLGKLSGKLPAWKTLLEPTSMPVILLKIKLTQKFVNSAWCLAVYSKLG